MEHRLDEVDRRILYRLMEDARDTSAPDIAEEVNVSAGTIRNRIHRLEDLGIIRGYHAGVDFELAAGKLTNLFVCSAPVSDREKFAKQVLEIPGVVDVRELMAGQRNLHVTAVGDDMNDITRISRAVRRSVWKSRTKTSSSATTNGRTTTSDPMTAPTPVRSRTSSVSPARPR
jgi:DNA-binding Lrp family transcriptional regulator